MALLTIKGREIPEGAVGLTRDEALQHQRKLINNWPSKIDVFSLTYAKEIIGAVTVFSGYVVMNYFARSYRLSSLYTFAVTTTYAVPVMLSTEACDKVITDNTLLMNMKCPLCKQLIFAGIQLYTSIVLPVAYGNLSLAALGTITGKYPFTSLLNDPRKFWAEQFKLVKGGTRAYQISGLLQTVLILGLPFLQAKQFSSVMKQIQVEDETEFLEE